MKLLQAVIENPSLHVFVVREYRIVLSNKDKINKKIGAHLGMIGSGVTQDTLETKKIELDKTIDGGKLL